MEAKAIVEYMDYKELMNIITADNINSNKKVKQEVKIMILGDQPLQSICKNSEQFDRQVAQIDTLSRIFEGTQ